MADSTTETIPEPRTVTTSILTMDRNSLSNYKKVGIVRPSRSDANSYLDTIRNSTRYASMPISTTSSTRASGPTTFYTPILPRMETTTSNQAVMSLDKVKIKYDDKGQVIQSLSK